MTNTLILVVIDFTGTDMAGAVDETSDLYMNACISIVSPEEADIPPLTEISLRVNKTGKLKHESVNKNSMSLLLYT